MQNKRSKTKRKRNRERNADERDRIYGKKIYCELIGDGTLTVEGFRRLLSYGDEEAVFSLFDGRRFSVLGERLTVCVIRSGVLALHGKITALRFFEESAE